MERNYTEDESKVEMLTFVSFASQRTFAQLKQTINSVRKLYRRPKLLIHDMGMTEEQRVELYKCTPMTIRKFKFDKYPAAVKNVANGRWKAIAIAVS